MTAARTHIVLALFVFLSACHAGDWQTDYSDSISRAGNSTDWRYGEVSVRISPYLRVSEANTYAPQADIVWQEDEFGDRRKQVGQIIYAATSNAARDLPGTYPVTINVELVEFHALTRKARYSAPGGVHNIAFTAQVFDTQYGTALSEKELIHADLPAMTGNDAVWAESHGGTQKARISAHIEAVMKGWLGVGPDVRSNFSGLGR